MSGCGGGGGAEDGSGGCGHPPPPQQQQQSGSFGSWARRHGTASTTTTPAAPEQQQPSTTKICMKCKALPAVTTLRQNEPYCHACIEAGVQQRCRIATKGQGLVSTGDSVLLALSGGAGSAALLYCMAGLQAPAGSQRPERGKVSYQLTVLHVDDSSSSSSSELQQQQQQELRVQLAALAAAAAGATQQLLVLHLSEVFCSDQQLKQHLLEQQQQSQQQQSCNGDASHDLQQPTAQGDGAPLSTARHATSQQQHDDRSRQQQLQELLASVADPTGREDLVTHLRDTLLQRAATALGCSRLLRGDSASRMAVRVIAEAAKGRGFSLPADIQGFDGRRLLAVEQQEQQGEEVGAGAGGGTSSSAAVASAACVLQPLREVTYKELQELCKYKSIPLLQQQQQQPAAGSNGGGGVGVQQSSSRWSDAKNVNVLAERLVGEMEASLPASIYTIIRTAAHLEPFSFSDAAAMVPQAAYAMRRQHKRNVPAAAAAEGGGGSSQQQQQPQRWQLCSICSAPLPSLAQQAQVGVGDASNSSSAHSSRLCYSCNRQILQHVRPAEEEAAASDAVSLQEQRLQRLKLLLPPGMLLEESDEEEEEDA